MGNRPPRYSCSKVNVGLVTVSFEPNPLARPFTNWVLPAPKSPTRASTSPAFIFSARRAPAPSVSAAPAEMNITREECLMFDLRSLMQVANACKLQFGKLPAPHSFQASAIAPRNGKQKFVIFAIGYCLLHGAAARNRERALINRETESARLR